MAKKRKRKIHAPPLSVTDKGIYYCLIAGSIIAALFLYPAIIGKFRRTVFQDAHILAQENPSTVFLTFFGMLVGGGLALLFNRLRRKRQPILGKANVKYGPPQWKPIYPFLSKQFWLQLYSNKKNFVFGSLCVFAFVLVLASTTLLGLPPRDCLYDDGTIKVYNCFDHKTAEYSQTDVTEIRIYTRPYHRRGTDDWGIEIKFSMKDGKNFFFSHKDFQTRDDTIRGSITGMYQIKQCFDPSIVTIDRKDNIDRVIWHMDLNRQEIELLYLLFDIDAPPQ